MRVRSGATLALVLAGLLTAGTAAVAASLDEDGVNLKAEWTDGGDLELELEDRNVEPAICFIWRHDAPQDGDSIASRILTRGGAVVVDLGIGDQWIEGSASGCEIVDAEGYRAVFADPGAYVVEFRVVEEQGTPPTRPARSRPLERD